MYGYNAGPMAIPIYTVLPYCVILVCGTCAYIQVHVHMCACLLACVCVCVCVCRQVSVEELSREAKRLAAVMQERHAELHCITQQV